MDLKFTEYFQLVVLKKRPYLKTEWLEAVLAHPLKTETQKDGRIKHWRYIAEMRQYLRVVTLEDGRTIHNAFPDRDFRRART